MSREQFLDDIKTKDAVIRNFTIIGEAINNLPDEIKLMKPEIEWRAIAGLRNILVHEYFGVNEQIIWNTIENELPEFETQIKSLLNELGG